MLDALPKDRTHDYTWPFFASCLTGTLSETRSRSPLVAGMARGTSPRSRVLTDDELCRIWHVAMGSHYGSFIRLLLLTATSPGSPCSRHKAGNLAEAGVFACVSARW